MEVYAKLKFSELVGDFVKDEAGIWWLINIKAMAPENQVLGEDLKKITHNIDDFIFGDNKNQKKGNKESIFKCQINLTKSTINQLKILKVFGKKPLMTSFGLKNLEKF